jgi:mRNA-degrading endonuclease RelE of RelBE toxin-antitoxin system
MELATGRGDIRKLSSGFPGLSGYENVWRLRVGDWRVFYQPGNRRITVLAIMHRREAYKKR